MASRTKPLRNNQEFQNRKVRKIAYFSALVLIVKFLIIWRISNLGIARAQGHIWLGADGEPYLTATDGLILDGILSKQDLLSYWPAGYPIFIYLLSFLGKSWTLTLLSVFQSVLYSFSIFRLGKMLIRNQLGEFAFIFASFALLNPTLSFSSMVIGYESMVASLLILIISFILEIITKKNEKNYLVYLTISGLGAVICFFQPRFLLTIPLIILIMLSNQKLIGKKYLLSMFAISMLILSISPMALIVRNYYSVNLKTISTNLGVTMNIGAGNSTGGYVKNPPGVPCQITKTQKDEADSQRIKCVVDWYLHNPKNAIKLFYNKSLYFWSPWFGPEANGTMARNPWLTIHPLKNMAKSQEGINLLYGTFGKFISWLWILGGIFFILYGYVFLRREYPDLRLFSLTALMVILSSWLVTLISIGDHRFRLPIMGMSLFLQSVGIRAIFSRRKHRMVPHTSLR